MAKKEIEAIKKEIEDVTAERDKHLQVYQDLDDLITTRTQEMSNEIRKLRGNRGNAIVLVNSCNDTVDRLTKLLAKLEGEK